jgi:hypothetical protein
LKNAKPTKGKNHRKFGCRVGAADIKNELIAIKLFLAPELVQSNQPGLARTPPTVRAFLCHHATKPVKCVSGL